MSAHYKSAHFRFWEVPHHMIEGTKQILRDQMLDFLGVHKLGPWDSGLFNRMRQITAEMQKLVLEGKIYYGIRSIQKRESDNTSSSLGNTDGGAG
jgi:hypothetical protein